MKDFLPKFEAAMDPKSVKELNSGALAFVGDSVQTLYVRTKCLLKSGAKSGELHRLTTAEVKAGAQAKDADLLLSHLTEEELDVFHHARNNGCGTPSKSATVGEYRKATGFEAVIGFLYLAGRHDRLLELLDLIENNLEE